MTATNTFSAKFTAALSALTLSLVLFANTTSVPNAAQVAPTHFATAYVGAVA